MRHLLNSLCITLFCLAAPVVRAAGVKTTCSGCEPGELAFARSEIDSLFAPAIAGTELEGNCRIRLECDPSIDDGSFGYRSEDGRRITVYGGDPISVTNGLHTLLERMGFLFDITGVTRPERADLAALDHADVRIRPNVRWRGIRQHVNFPMDISSYPIDQAKRYLENLVRMRFNKFVVHSYIFMWHEEPVSQDSTNYAGSFFYGHRHDFSDSPFLKSVNRENRSIFCIPDIEPCYDDVPERSKRAVAWMGELLDYAKSLGLYVQFSYEPRHSTVERAVRLGQIIARTYPRIDALELMTEETGGWGPSCTAEEVRAKLLEFFPSDVLSDTLAMNAIRDRQPDMAELYHQIGTNMEAIRRMECDPGMKGIRKFVLGIYCSIPDQVGPAYHLALKYLPGHDISIMPSHGSDGVAAAVERIVTDPADLRHTQIYSWIEFDGLMYMQQNAIDGLERLFGHVERLGGGEMLHSICFNHWRSAENRTTFRFAADACLSRGVSRGAFYEEYARRLGIRDAETYAEAMRLINEADSYATVNLGNIGFCWVGAWSNGSLFTWMKRENIDRCSALYAAAGARIAAVRAGTRSLPGLEYLDLLVNRIDCSILYLEAFRHASALEPFTRSTHGSLSEQDRAAAASLCTRSLRLFDRYMELYASLMPDRGSLGTVVSVWFAPMHGLKVLRNRLTGIPLEQQAPVAESADEPPLPILYQTN